MLDIIDIESLLTREIKYRFIFLKQYLKSIKAKNRIQ